MKTRSLPFVALAVSFLQPVGEIQAADGGIPAEENVKLESKETFSPYANRNFPTQVFWGDTHLHTGLSLDAGVFGNTLRPSDAYKLARGEQVISSTGLPVRLGRPLDWLAVADHTDLMGIAPDVQQGTPNIMANDFAKGLHEGYSQGGEAAGKAAFELITRFSQMTLPEDLVAQYSPGSPIFKNVWEEIIDTAEEYNDPGKFTAFIAFEWTSVPKGFNLHRNVILRDDGDRAKLVQPLTTQPPSGTTNPLDLYKWLEAYEEKTGGQAFALAHNGNLSNGWMFPTEDTYHGGKVDEEYVRLRAKWEPQYEITQIKGDGEAHPFLSPDDPFADYENWDVGNLDITQLKTNDMLKGEYAREALKQGLKLEKKFGVNPYKFGVGGATDSHTSLSTAEEENFFSKSVSTEPSKTRIQHPFVKSELGEIPGHLIVSSGYTGIWAEENTRASLFDAMQRKETYATTGPRISVRFFGGWEFTEDDLSRPLPARAGYSKGRPMGSDMTAMPEGATAPSFMLYALRDTIGANLDRLQIVKGWLDAEGELHEKVYDVAVSGGRTINENGVCEEAVGNTVDVETATWTNSIGDAQLGAVWTDPDFDAAESAFYYARVLEIPTPRWVLYDKLRFGAEIPEEAEVIGQERAYTSPIWYTPKKEE